MYLDRGLLKQVQQTFQKLNCGLILLDEDGADVLGDKGETYVLPEKIASDSITVYGNFAFLPVSDAGTLTLAIRKNADGAFVILHIAQVLVENMLQNAGTVFSDADVYLRVLRREITGTEIEQLAQEHHLSLNRPRCVMVFSVRKAENVNACHLLGELLPRAEEDVLLEVDRHQVVLVKDMEGMEGEEELYQFACAADETVQGEAAVQFTIGIGQMRESLSALADSYQEAKRAIELGRLFQPDEHLFLYGRMLLERLLTELPNGIGQYYHSILFNRKTVKVFNEEMLETIEMFFKKDLNLSDTARQMYIHRNTLTYRLDKVQKCTGLDLRRFDDAVTFCLLLKLKKCEGEAQNH